MYRNSIIAAFLFIATFSNGQSFIFNQFFQPSIRFNSLYSHDFNFQNQDQLNIGQFNINCIIPVKSKLKLKVNVLSENVFDKKIKMKNDVFLSRAFKPLVKTLELIHNQANNWNKILIYQGKTGDEELLLASKSWNIKYKQWSSVTSRDSKILEINELKKKIE